MAISQLFYGPCADRFGRKPVLLMGMTLGFLGSLVCVFSPNVNILILGRFIQGMGAGAGNVLFRVILRDTFSGKELSKVAAWTTTFYSLAPAIAPVIGGYIEVSFGWRMDFILLSIYGFIQMIAAFLGSLIIASWHTHNQLPLAVIFTILAVGSLWLFRVCQK